MSFEISNTSYPKITNIPDDIFEKTKEYKEPSDSNMSSALSHLMSELGGFDCDFGPPSELSLRTTYDKHESHIRKIRSQFDHPDSKISKKVSAEFRAKLASSTAPVTPGAPSAESRADTLKKLWNCSKPASFFDMHPEGPALQRQQEAEAWKDKGTIEKNLQKNPEVDYFGGRCIKSNLSDPKNEILTSFQENCRPDKTREEIEKCLAIQD